MTPVVFERGAWASAGYGRTGCLGQSEQTKRYRPTMKEEERRLVEQMLALLPEHLGVVEK